MNLIWSILKTMFKGLCVLFVIGLVLAVISMFTEDAAKVMDALGLASLIGILLYLLGSLVELYSF